MKKVLIPIDGSDDSFRAAIKARDLIDCRNCDVEFLYVEDFQPYIISSLPQDIIEIAERKKDEILEKARQRFKDSFRSVRTVALKGDPATEITEYAKKGDFDMVIMGSHGMGAAKRFLLGSVANKVVLDINKPILIVK